MISKKLAKILIIFIGAISTYNTSLAETDKVIVAGGCFWCVEADFEGLDLSLIHISEPTRPY